MKRSFVALGALLFAAFGLSFARQSSSPQSNDNSKQTAEYKIPAEEVARVNPVKPSPEGLAEARKIFGYDCAMCHGHNGDGKGDLVESMKLEMHDWRDVATLTGKTDGELFYIISNGKGKMVSEADRASEKLRWNLVNLVRAMAAKTKEQKAAATTPAP